MSNIADKNISATTKEPTEAQMVALRDELRWLIVRDFLTQQTEPATGVRIAVLQSMLSA